MLATTADSTRLANILHYVLPADLLCTSAAMSVLTALCARTLYALELYLYIILRKQKLPPDFHE